MKVIEPKVVICKGGKTVEELLEENDMLRAAKECLRIEVDSLEEFVDHTTIENIELREKVREFEEDRDRLDWLELRFPFLARQTKAAPAYYTPLYSHHNVLRLREAIDGKRNPADSAELERLLREGNEDKDER
jgi:hypothetical protein